ncbi:acyl-CoA dehydrogenase family protein [Myroides fluvii]|uniref:hypothetical protein n=1 Tax=Myroides fluvii TaxID=2572594 RepID=UPI00131D3AD8|nr:hypothetical protein [Myroides fluvii]
MLSDGELRARMQGATAISDEVINHIYKKRWLQIWVPQSYGGLGCDFKTGITYLYEWAKIDGSLGWMLTLCSGANYFARNMLPETAKRLFAKEYTCFGGSGMVGGTADEQEDGSYLLQGVWHYATGAPYLSHFTLNARLLKQGKPRLDAEGNPCIRSFIVEQSKVTIIPNWKSMGMKATGTFSFEVNQVTVPADYHFVYDTFYTADVVTKIPFRTFADLTLLVNYLGMAYHYMEEAQTVLPAKVLASDQSEINTAFETVLDYASQIEIALANNAAVALEIQEEIHTFGTQVVAQLIEQVIRVHVQLGIKGTQVDQPIHQVFADFFTATQHANFRSDLTVF